MTKEDLEEMEFGAADDLREVIALAKWAITEAKPALDAYKHMAAPGSSGPSQFSSAAEALAKYPGRAGGI